jgi:hypothetical protein
LGFSILTTNTHSNEKGGDWVVALAHNAQPPAFSPMGTVCDERMSCAFAMVDEVRVRVLSASFRRTCRDGGKVVLSAVVSSHGHGVLCCVDVRVLLLFVVDCGVFLSEPAMAH